MAAIANQGSSSDDDYKPKTPFQLPQQSFRIDTSESENEGTNIQISAKKTRKRPLLIKKSPSYLKKGGRTWKKRMREMYSSKLSRNVSLTTDESKSVQESTMDLSGVTVELQEATTDLEPESNNDQDGAVIDKPVTQPNDQNFLQFLPPDELQDIDDNSDEHASSDYYYDGDEEDEQMPEEFLQDHEFRHGDNNEQQAVEEEMAAVLEGNVEDGGHGLEYEDNEEDHEPVSLNFLNYHKLQVVKLYNVQLTHQATAE